MPEPHKLRRIEILKAHPEIKELMGEAALFASRHHRPSPHPPQPGQPHTRATCQFNFRGKHAPYASAADSNARQSPDLWAPFFASVRL